MQMYRMFSKVRPVGSPVPKPTGIGVLSLPWGENYTTTYCSSGTDALSMAVRLAIKAKGRQTRPQVIIPAYGCPDLIAAIVAQNAQPVLVDFADSSPVLDVDCLKDALTEQTVAIIAVNFLGLHERLSLLSQFCAVHGLILIEDSAQCFPPGGTAHGLADFIVLSFGRGKPINLLGGGALLVKRSRESLIQDLRLAYPSEALRIDLFWHLKRLAFNLLLSRYFFPLLERIPFLHLGKTRFKPLTKQGFCEIPSAVMKAGIVAINERQPLHEILDQKLDFLEDAGWKLLKGEGENSYPRLRYALLAPDGKIRDQVLGELNRKGIGASALYKRVLPEIQGVPVVELNLTHLYPRASDFAARLLTLPVHEGVNENDVEIIVSVLERFACLTFRK